MGLFKKGQKAYSVVNLKCPKCHEGEMFPTSTFSFKKSFDMHERCPVCNEDYFPEPGFYYGAMFISYIWTGFFCLGFVAFTIFVLKMSINMSFLALIAFMALIFVWIFRVSRVMWINVVVHYDKNAIEK
ncbi:MAG: DUF983 domain-containing protein [Saprospiraceae bacterium]|nr:DUF983 domain-containing protein [Saprospiraceae bacterium]